MKTCNTCKEAKQPGDFYANNKASDGLLSRCKECHKAAIRENRKNNLDRIRTYDRMRALRPERIKNVMAQTKKWRAGDARRTAAHNAVARAMRKGTLEHKTCEWPGCSREDSYAHHEDYDKPLDVVFYCQPHHKARHAEMKRLGIDPLNRATVEPTKCPSSKEPQTPKRVSRPALWASPETARRTRRQRSPSDSLS